MEGREEDTTVDLDTYMVSVKSSIFRTWENQWFLGSTKQEFMKDGRIQEKLEIRWEERHGRKEKA